MDDTIEVDILIYIYIYIMYIHLHTHMHTRVFHTFFMSLSQRGNHILLFQCRGLRWAKYSTCSWWRDHAETHTWHDLLYIIVTLVFLTQQASVQELTHIKCESNDELTPGQPIQSHFSTECCRTCTCVWGSSGLRSDCSLLVNRGNADYLSHHHPIVAHKSQ